MWRQSTKEGVPEEAFAGSIRGHARESAPYQFTRCTSRLRGVCHRNYLAQCVAAWTGRPAPAGAHRRPSSEGSWTGCSTPGGRPNQRRR